MSKARWSDDDMRKAGLVQGPDGTYVPVKSLVAKGKVSKLPPLQIKTVDLFGKQPENSAIKFGEYCKISFVEDALIVKTPAMVSEHFGLPTGELLHVKLRFNIDPCPAPRMTQKDKWLMPRRKPVERYFNWRNAFTAMCAEVGYKLTPVLRVVFVVPFPKSYSKKKREQLNNQPNQIRPDTDNYTKSLKDSFNVDDGFVWDERSIKVWGEKGQIIIF